MRLAVLVLASFLAFSPALAAGDEEAEGEKPAATGLDASDVNMIELPMLVAPVTVNGRLYHYAYIRVLLLAKDGTVADLTRNKVPYIIDAMLRETHRESIAAGDDPKVIDGDALKKRLLAAAESVIGAGSFKEISFRDTIQTDDPTQPPPEPAMAAETETASAPHEPAKGGH